MFEPWVLSFVSVVTPDQDYVHCECILISTCIVGLLVNIYCIGILI